jgi:DNA-binding transcriptional ArsR family regulator
MANISAIEALGDPTRRQLFERLRQGSCSVTELISIVPISQPAVSQHLKVLRDAQLVKVEKRGQQRIYHLNPVGLAELRRYAEDLWDDVLRAFGEEAERMARNEEATQIEVKKKKS